VSSKTRRLILIVVLVFSALTLTGAAAKEEKIAIEEYLENAAPEEWGRYYFSLAIENWGEADYIKAREAIEKAFERPVYPKDIPKLWYFLAKMNIETGNTDDAVDSLNNVLLIEPDRTEILILLKTLRMLGRVEPLSNPIIGLNYLNEVKGFVNTYEFFYNPVASEIYQETIYILDRANSFIFVVKGDDNELIELDLEAPSSIAVDKTAGILYISDLEAGKIQVMDLRTREIIDEYDGFKKPFVQTVDRLGNVYVLDPAGNKMTILSSRGKTVKHIFLSEGYTPDIINDVDVSVDKIILQDMSKRNFRIVRLGSFEEEMTFDFRNNAIPVASCIGPSGQIITVWNDEEITTFFPEQGTEYTFLDTENIDLTGISDIDFTPPILSLTDFNDHVVKEYLIIQENPNSFTVIDAIEAGENDLAIQFRTLNNLGTHFQFISPFLNVIDSGGFVPFELEAHYSKVQYIEVNDGEQFFTEGFKNLKKTDYNVVVWKYDGYDFNFENIAPAMFSKNVRVYVLSNLSVPDKVQSLARKTGGIVISTDQFPFLKQYLTDLKEVWTPRISYKLSLPFTGINTVTISTRIAGLDYSDSIYYVNYMIPYFTKQLEASENDE